METDMSAQQKTVIVTGALLPVDGGQSLWRG